MILIALIVGVDLLFFRHRLLERLKANTGIVMVFVPYCFGAPRRLRADQGPLLRGGASPSTIQEDRGRLSSP